MPSKTTYQLEQEIITLNMQLDGFAKTVYEKNLHIAGLGRELAEMRKDAERYRVLRNSGRYSPCPFGNGWGLGRGANPLDLDKAVDEYAASVAQAKKEQG